jgi:hypothetical protein
MDGRTGFSDYYFFPVDMAAMMGIMFTMTSLYWIQERGGGL